MSDKNRILVVGGAGYIGSHCCKALAGAGYRPVCFDNFSTGHRGFVKWGPVIEGDIHDQSHLVDSIKQHGVIAVLHLAASSLVGESVSDPEKYYCNNVGGTLSLLRAMRQTQCKTLVFSSSGAVYGESHHGLICESELLRPVNPYGRTKLIIEEMLADFQKAYTLAPVCLRYFNASGADLSGKIGEDHDPETHLIPRALLAVEGRVDDFAIYGDDYDTPDGTAIRDYIHVMDLAQAHILALEYLVSGGAGGCFNLGTGRGHSVSKSFTKLAPKPGRTPRLSSNPGVMEIRQFSLPIRRAPKRFWVSRRSIRSSRRSLAQRGNGTKAFTASRHPRQDRSPSRCFKVRSTHPMSPIENCTPKANHRMPVRQESPTDRMILQLRSEGLSFREISIRLCLSLGSVTGRYYRLKGVRHPSQVKRDERLKEDRRMCRIARNRERSSAAVQAAVELRGGIAFSTVVGKARSKGASLEMIGACLGISKQAVHKQLQQRGLLRRQ